MRDYFTPPTVNYVLTQHGRGLVENEDGCGKALTPRDILFFAGEMIKS
jgi:hypothetical protein